MILNKTLFISSLTSMCLSCQSFAAEMEMETEIPSTPIRREKRIIDQYDEETKRPKLILPEEMIITGPSVRPRKMKEIELSTPIKGQKRKMEDEDDCDEEPTKPTSPEQIESYFPFPPRSPSPERIRRVDYDTPPPAPRAERPHDYYYNPKLPQDPAPLHLGVDIPLFPFFNAEAGIPPFPRDFGEDTYKRISFSHINFKPNQDRLNDIKNTQEIL